MIQRELSLYYLVYILLDFFSVSVQSLSRVQLFVTPWTAACQASLSITNSWSLLKLTSVELVMPSNHLILYHPLLLPPSILPSIRVLFSSLHQVAKVLEFQLQRQSFQWILEIIHVFLSVFLSCWRNEISSSFLPSPISPFPSFLLSSALSFKKKKKTSVFVIKINIYYYFWKLHRIIDHLNRINEYMWSGM